MDKYRQVCYNKRINNEYSGRSNNYIEVEGAISGRAFERQRQLEEQGERVREAGRVAFSASLDVLVDPLAAAKAQTVFYREQALGWRMIAQDPILKR